MDILLRKHLRHIMCSKQSTANETLQLDAGWNRVETEILVKKIRLYAEVIDGHRGTLANEIATIAMTERTPWFTELESRLGERRIKLLLQRTPKSRNTVISEIRNIDKIEQLHRLEEECPTTTGTFRQLNELKKFKYCKPYLKVNSHMTNAIRLIHAVRAGNSDLLAQQFIRHQTSQDTCRI